MKNGMEKKYVQTPFIRNQVTDECAGARHSGVNLGKRVETVCTHRAFKTKISHKNQQNKMQIFVF